MEGPGIRRVDNESFCQTTRTSQDGKIYTYKLNVLQQPFHARACGSGVKAQADRRPVDPPPIVELKIFEGENAENDVTYSMNCDYFLFATLEQARNQAHGRVKQADDQHPVLKGMPAAGIVYLERPKPAGYFIFADLSVQHEGKYRLSFSLFEMIKDPKDEDRTDEYVPDPNGAVVNRMEVKSVPFVVYSAKKFPGLKESTHLSRVVAEQGCRVRIRRDVRMRRRENKSGKDWDAYEDETADIRARVSATPETNTYAGQGYIEPIPRPRSNSNASRQSLAPNPSRRPSLQEVQVQQAYPHHQYANAPQTPQNTYTQQSPANVAGPSPSQQYAQLPFAQQSTMRPPPPNYHQQSHVHPPAPAAPQHQYHSCAAVPPPATGYAQRHSADYTPRITANPRRASAAPTYPSMHDLPAYSPAPLVPTAPVASTSSYHSAYATYPNPRTHRQSTGSMPAYTHTSAKVETVQPSTGIVSSRSQVNRDYDRLPPLNTSFNICSSMKPIEPSTSPVAPLPNPSYHMSPYDQGDSHKRNYGQVFSERHLQQPLRQGARPTASAFPIPGLYSALDEVDDQADGNLDHSLANPVRMLYRRADGREISRNLPPSE